MKTQLLAQLKIPGYDTPIEAPGTIRTGGANFLENVLATGIQIFLIGVILFSLGYILWAGINWIRSEGDAQKLHDARMQIVYAIIGLAVAFLSFAIINIIGYVLGVNLLNPS